jgi:uncharacterized protein
MISHEHMYANQLHVSPGSNEAASDAVKDFLSKHGLAEDIIGRVCYVVDNVSYSKEIKGEKKECPYGEKGKSELSCVQDADRLDAVGAVGIARCVSLAHITR